MRFRWISGKRYHKVGLERLEQVKWAILEADGAISIVPWRQEQRQVRPEHHAGPVA